MTEGKSQRREDDEEKSNKRRGWRAEESTGRNGEHQWKAGEQAALLTPRDRGEDCLLAPVLDCPHSSSSDREWDWNHADVWDKKSKWMNEAKRLSGCHTQTRVCSGCIRQVKSRMTLGLSGFFTAEKTCLKGTFFCYKILTWRKSYFGHVVHFSTGVGL